MTCDRPLRELTGVPDDREEAEESEPWEEDFSVPLATEENMKDRVTQYLSGHIQWPRFTRC